jgi:hypothetical protein
MLPALPGLVAAVVLAAALYFLRRQHVLGSEIDSLWRQLRDLSARLASAEKNAEGAAGRAEAAANVLLEKGIANEEELEAARRHLEAPEDPQPARGSRTLH